MTRLRFDPSGFEIDVARGDRILDVTDEHLVPDVSYSCRGASCGTCRVEVMEGADAFAYPEEDEAGVLALYGDPPDHRLACQLRVAREVPRIVLRRVED